MIHLSQRAINLHGLTEDSGCHKTGEMFDHWKAQHNSFCSYIFAIPLSYRTELLSSECGKLTLTGLCTDLKGSYLKEQVLFMWDGRQGLWCFYCKTRYKTFVNHVTGPLRSLQSHLYCPLDESDIFLSSFGQIRMWREEGISAINNSYLYNES